MLMNNRARLKGLMGLLGWQPPCLQVRSFCSCQSSNEGVTAAEEREESLPQSLHPPSLSPSLVASPLDPGSLAIPDDTIPFGSPGPLPPLNVVPPGRQSPLSLRPFYPARRPGIPVFPFRRPRVRAASPPNQYRQTS